MTLSAEQLTLIKALWMPREFEKGQFFQRAGEVTTHGAFVVRGCFRTYLTAANARVVPGNYAGNVESNPPRRPSIVTSDGNAGAGQQGHIPRPDVSLTSEELATVGCAGCPSGSTT